MSGVVSRLLLQFTTAPRSSNLCTASNSPSAAFEINTSGIMISHRTFLLQRSAKGHGPSGNLPFTHVVWKVCPHGVVQSGLVPPMRCLQIQHQLHLSGQPCPRRTSFAKQSSWKAWLQGSTTTGSSFDTSRWQITHIFGRRQRSHGKKHLLGQPPSMRQWVSKQSLWNAWPQTRASVSSPFSTPSKQMSHCQSPSTCAATAIEGMLLEEAAMLAAGPTRLPGRPMPRRKPWRSL